MCLYLNGYIVDISLIYVMGLDQIELVAYRPRSVCILGVRCLVREVFLMHLENFV